MLAAIEAAGRDEFFMVGGAGSKNVMDAIKADNTVLKATVVYPSTQAADGVKLARLLVQEKAHERPGGRADVPRKIQLYAPVVTKDNVDQYLPIGVRVLTPRPRDAGRVVRGPPGSTDRKDRQT